MQIRLKRHFIRVEVIGKDSDQRLRYHMFKRLNTGGESLSEQEIRNWTVRLLDGGAKLMKFVVELSLLDTFRLCTDTLSDVARQERFDQELVLRFFAFKNNRATYRHDVSDFITHYMEAISDSATGQEFDYEQERIRFSKTFEILSKTLDERAFGWANKHGTLVRGFGVYQFEAFTLGLQSALERIDPNNQAHIDRLRTLLEGIKKDTAFIGLTTGGGKNTKGALDNRIQFVESRIPTTL